MLNVKKQPNGACPPSVCLWSLIDGWLIFSSY
jgi:hypothetical protein